MNGTNAYAILKAPKTDGAEALVLSASWLSRARDAEGERKVNIRGVAIVLALANFLESETSSLYKVWGY
jgi:glycosylphosphatidylinositol transamidase